MCIYKEHQLSFLVSAILYYVQVSTILGTSQLAYHSLGLVNKQGVTPDGPSMRPAKKERWVEGKKEGKAVRRSGSSTGRLGTAVGP
jgi:hypothetical protein